MPEEQRATCGIRKVPVVGVNLVIYGLITFTFPRVHCVVNFPVSSLYRSLSRLRVALYVLAYLLLNKWGKLGTAYYAVPRRDICGKDQISWKTNRANKVVPPHKYPVRGSVISNLMIW